MCGINAVISDGNVEEDLKSLLPLNHRGPDERCNWIQGKVNIDYFRLSVTGGQAGEPPVTSEDSRWICFLNGEIYNFRSLATTYLGSNLSSDTKVLVEGVSKFGLEFLHLVSGMFAGILIDKLTSKVYVFRDFFGEKPLFYSFGDNLISISSEFNALLEKFKNGIEMNFGALADYFRFGYIEEPKTIDSRIMAFPKGAIVTIDLENKKILREFTINPSNNVYGALSTLISVVVGEVLESDVSQAYLLSGGFDSTTLLKFSKGRSLAEDQAFTLKGVGDSNLRDVNGAKKAAKRLGIKHNIVHISQAEVLARLPEMVLALDQPHADMSSFGYFRLFEEIAARNLKVAQVGHGVDEMFWGYKWFNELTDSLNDEIGERIFWRTPSDQTQLLDPSLDFFKEESIRNLHPSDSFLLSSNKYQRARAEICHSYLSHNGLTQLDRLAMHHSVEPRAAFADSRLYFWAQQNSLNSRDFEKRAFRSAVSNPFQLAFSKRKKRGFDIGMMQYVNSIEFEKLYKEQVMSLGNFNIALDPNLKFPELGARQKYRLLVLSLWMESK